jgi:hypothetical protein
VLKALLYLLAACISGFVGLVIVLFFLVLLWTLLLFYFLFLTC